MSIADKIRKIQAERLDKQARKQKADREHRDRWDSEVQKTKEMLRRELSDINGIEFYEEGFYLAKIPINSMQYLRVRVYWKDETLKLYDEDNGTEVTHVVVSLVDSKSGDVKKYFYNPLKDIDKFSDDFANELVKHLKY
jgi:hypothetical protein